MNWNDEKEALSVLYVLSHDSYMNAQIKLLKELMESISVREKLSRCNRTNYSILGGQSTITQRGNNSLRSTQLA